MPVKLYGFSLSPPYRAVLLTAKAIGLELEEKEVDMHGKQEHKTEAFLKMNPTHTVPTLDDDGFYMWESRAIMGYLVQQYAKDDTLYPKEPKKRATVDNMLYFDADCLFASIQQYFYPIIRLGADPNPVTKDLIVERLGFFNTILKDRKYAAGDHLTIADYSIICSVMTAEACGLNLEDFTNITAWIARVEAETPFYNEVAKEGNEKLKGFLASKLKK